MTNSIASGSAPQANPDQKIAKKELFPQTLYKMLKYTEEQGLNDVISWLPSNVGFFVHDEKKFMQKIFPIFFRGKQFSSFIRQLNLYGFKKISNGFEKGGFYHENFTRLNPSFARIRRLCGKSDAIRSSPERKLKVLNNVMPNAKGGFRHLPDRTNLPAEDPLKSLFKKAFRLDSQASNPCLEASDPEEKLVSAKDLMGIDPTHSILVGKKTVEGYKVINTKNIDGTDLSNYEVGGFVGKNVMIEVGNEIHVDEFGNPFLLLKSIFVGKDSKVFGKTQLFGHAKIYQSAQVAEKAKIYGNAHIYGKALIFEHAEVYDSARINGTAWVYGKAHVFGKARVKGDAEIFGQARVYGRTQLSGNSKVFGQAQVYGRAEVGKKAMIYNHAQVSGKAWISDYAKLFGYAQVFGHAWVYERAQVYDNAKIYGHTQVERDEHIYGDTELVVKW